MTVRRESMSTGQARGARLVARGKSRAFRREVSAPSLWPRASRPPSGDCSSPVHEYAGEGDKKTGRLGAGNLRDIEEYVLVNGRTIRWCASLDGQL